jgi:hypothetical protein
LEFIGDLNVEETRGRRSSHPRNCVVHLAENGVKKFFSRSPEPSLVAPCEEEEEEDSSSGEEESEQSVAPLKPRRSPTSS